MSTDASSKADPTVAATPRSDRAAPVRAAVCAGTITTQYLRGGSGDLVVFLADPSTEPKLDPLFVALAASYRVVAPDPGWPNAASGTPGPSFATWLRGFLDGLGAGEASIVARSDRALSALAFALTDMDRVRKVVLCFRDAADPQDADSPLAEQLDDARCRILLVRETAQPRSDAERELQHRAIIDFLRRGESDT